MIGGPPRNSHLARNLKVAREEKRLTKRGLAALAAVQNNTVHYIEAGKIKDPRGSYILRIAEILGVSVSWLYYGSGSPSRQTGLERKKE